MAEIKSQAAITEKWTRVTPMRSEDYKKGIESPKRDWAKSATAAAPNHATAMAAASAAGSYGKGINKAGTEKWKARSLSKGPGRFAEGVMVGGPDYDKGFAPFRDVIERTALPPRFPARDPRNIMRVSAIATALGKAKTG